MNGNGGELSTFLRKLSEDRELQHTYMKDPEGTMRQAGLSDEALGGELVPLGSAGAKTAAVLLGEADVFVHAGGQHAWDTAAPVAVALAAGAHVSRIDGSPVRFDCADPWTPDLLVCRPSLREAALTVLASLPGGPATGR